MSDFTKPFSKSEMDAIRGRAEAARAEAEARGRETLERGFWGKLRAAGRRIPFAEDVVAAWYCTLDPKTPSRVKIVLAGAIAYFVLPLDAVADFLPVLGFADDAALIAAALAQVAGSITEEHRQKARDALRDEELADIEA